ncbi:hypothetical protein [Marinobacter salicampi]|uniref:hypothetical protein n=1 Tax=Marinobacter salicampi TaxID=435907 RepID=UPI0014092300|nr:hypothetical protein [Marinobacter salicampi]
MNVLSLRLTLMLLCLALPAWVAAFPPQTSIELSPGQNGPFTPPSAGPDWYRLTLGSFSSVTLYSQRSENALDGIEPSATLLNSDGEVIATAEDNAPNEQFRIEERLAAGTYYLKIDAPLLVSRDEAAVRYELFWR